MIFLSKFSFVYFFITNRYVSSGTNVNEIYMFSSISYYLLEHIIKKKNRIQYAQSSRSRGTTNDMIYIKIKRAEKPIHLTSSTVFPKDKVLFHPELLEKRKCYLKCILTQVSVQSFAKLAIY